jgi:hypothetical protein
VYGKRISEPTNAGKATRKNFPAASMPYSGPMDNTRTDQIVHIENPMCSAKIENHRLRLATSRPVPSQNCASSGSQ